MADDDVQYESKDVHVLRGTETRARTKAAADGWEFVEVKARSSIRSTLTFRRPKKKVPLKAWIIGGAAAAVLVGIIVTGAVLERANEPDALTPSATPTSPSKETVLPEPVESATSDASAVTVTDAEVLAAFNDFFAERAAAGVMLGKAVTGVTFEDGLVRVTFDPAAASVTQADFDAFNPFDNLASFAATPIAFNNEVGNRVRPAVEYIDTVRADGVPLGTFSRTDILALNELEK